MLIEGGGCADMFLSFGNGLRIALGFYNPQFVSGLRRIYAIFTPGMSLIPVSRPLSSLFFFFWTISGSVGAPLR
jgi:hypothetical protein